MFTLETLQKEQGAWQEKNFGPSPSWHALLGVQEEAGELCHAHLKSVQGIRTNENHQAAKIDAVGDIVIYLAAYCNLEGIDLQLAVEQTWQEVSQRNWKANQVNGKTTEARND